MSKTQDRIKELLANNAKMSQPQILNDLSTIYGIDLTSEAVWRNLKNMADDGILKVESVSRPTDAYGHSKKKKTWYYIYSLRKQKKIE